MVICKSVGSPHLNDSTIPNSHELAQEIILRPQILCHLLGLALHFLLVSIEDLFGQLLISLLLE